MKILKTLLSLWLLCMTLSPSVAQTVYFTPSYDYEYEYFKGWQGVRVSYLPATIEMPGTKDIKMNGAMVAYVKSWGIIKNVPLYIESGIGLTYAGGEIDDTRTTLNTFSLNIPVNIGFCHHINSTISLSPFIGIALQGNLFGNYKYGDESYNLFDKNEMGGMAMKRFNAGWQAGLNVSFYDFNITGSYGKDFNEIIGDGKWCIPKLSVGFNF